MLRASSLSQDPVSIPRHSFNWDRVIIWTTAGFLAAFALPTPPNRYYFEIVPFYIVMAIFVALLAFFLSSLVSFVRLRQKNDFTVIKRTDAGTTFYTLVATAVFVLADLTYFGKTDFAVPLGITEAIIFAFLAFKFYKGSVWPVWIAAGLLFFGPILEFALSGKTRNTIVHFLIYAVLISHAFKQRRAKILSQALISA